MISSQISELTCKLMELREKKQWDEEFSSEEKTIISDLSKLCKTTQFYKYIKQNYQKEQKEFKDIEPYKLYKMLIHKIADAPFLMYAISSVIALIPIIDKNIKNIDKRVKT